MAKVKVQPDPPQFSKRDLEPGGVQYVYTPVDGTVVVRCGAYDFVVTVERATGTADQPGEPCVRVSVTGSTVSSLIIRPECSNAVRLFAAVQEPDLLGWSGGAKARHAEVEAENAEFWKDKPTRPARGRK